MFDEVLPHKVWQRLVALSLDAGFDLGSGLCRVRRTSSRFCLGVEHGDYNGTELFGVGTDRFLWLAFRPNDRGRVRLLSGNFPEDGVLEFVPDEIPLPGDPAVRDSWARFPLGVAHILRRAGRNLGTGFDGVLWGDIPGGGMSRSASLTLNLILTAMEIGGHEVFDPLLVVDWAVAVENDYIGSPCGEMDQVMILFARAEHGVHYAPATRTVCHVPLPPDTPDFRLVSLDTGTVRPGLEKSTYRVRRAECEELVALARPEFGILCLADVREPQLYDSIVARFAPSHPHLMARLRYLFAAQRRFGRLLDAYIHGDLEAVGAVFRADGLGLRNDYAISGPELETMCDIARTVPGVLGERMLGGGDKGAAGAIVLAAAVPALRDVVGTGYPRSYPDLADSFAVHELRSVEGVVAMDVCDGVVVSVQPASFST